MGTEQQTEVAEPNSTISVDLWKFFEERGSKLKESMFQVVTWILGFDSVVLGFAVKEGFEKGLKIVANPFLLIIIGLVGFILLGLAVIVILDYGKHINRTFARADAARKGESSPIIIWNASSKTENQSLPPVCWHLIFVVGFFAVVFSLFIFLGICTACISN